MPRCGRARACAWGSVCVRTCVVHVGERTGCVWFGVFNEACLGMDGSPGVFPFSLATSVSNL